jgi:hypothetical protein
MRVLGPYYEASLCSGNRILFTYGTVYIATRSKEVIIRKNGWREFGEPGLCFVCTWLGVVSSTALPTTLLWPVLPASLVTTGVVLSPVATFAVAALVFDIRAWHRWYMRRYMPLGVRLLASYSDGVMWLRWLRCRY